jgi:hypothetical protein
MPTWMLTEETVTLGSSLPEAYTCAGRVINWDLHINNVDMLTNKKWVRSRILHIANVLFH